VLGDRRDHFESIKDVWEIFRIVSEERKRRRSIHAARARGVRAGSESDPKGDAYTRERLESMLEFLTAMTGLFEEIIRMPTGALKGVVNCAEGITAARDREEKAADEGSNEISK